MRLAIYLQCNFVSLFARPSKSNFSHSKAALANLFSFGLRFLYFISAQIEFCLILYLIFATRFCLPCRALLLASVFATPRLAQVSSKLSSNCGHKFALCVECGCCVISLSSNTFLFGFRVLFARMFAVSNKRKFELSKICSRSDFRGEATHKSR